MQNKIKDSAFRMDIRNQTEEASLGNNRSTQGVVRVDGRLGEKKETTG